MMKKIKGLECRFNQYYDMYIKQQFSPLKKKLMFTEYVFDKVFLGASFIDFFELTLYKKSFIKKMHYCLSKWDLRFTNTLDALKTRDYWYDKRKMYEQIHSFVGREQLFTEIMSFDEYLSFVDKHPSFIMKPTRDECGNGVQLVKAQKADLKGQYDELVTGNYVIDELIEQNEYMKNICPKSVNTIRIFTIRFKNEIEFVGSALRFGTGNSVVDNYSAGGGVCSLNIKTGESFDLAENMYGERFQFHPMTNTDMTKIKVPMWEDILNLVKKAAQQYPLNYVAWDVAVRENDVVLVEANPHGMVNVIQIAGARGRKKQYKAYLKKWNSEQKGV